MSPDKEFRVGPASGTGQRLDSFLAEKTKSLTRSQVQKAIASGGVTVNGEARKPGYRLKEGDSVFLAWEKPETGSPEPEDIGLEILHADAHIVVLNKPSGMVVHPGSGVRRKTLVNALLFRFSEIRGVGPEERPGIVHRLDKETSGVMVVARNAAAYRSLQRMFKNREVRKVYLGLVHGRVPAGEGRIDWAVGRHAKHGLKFSVRTRKPRQALTLYRVRRAFKDYSLLEISPVTGRTHQIRVHFSAAGYPLAGDTRYGHRRTRAYFPRLFLHASSLSFLHPETGKRVSFSAPLPEELSAVLESLPRL